LQLESVADDHPMKNSIIFFSLVRGKSAQAFCIYDYEMGKNRN